MKHIKYFKNNNEYVVFSESDMYIEPHVSLANLEQIVHYNKKMVPPIPSRHMTHVITEEMYEDEWWIGPFSLNAFSSFMVNGEEQIKPATKSKTINYSATQIDGDYNDDYGMIFINSFDESKLFSVGDGNNINIQGDFDEEETEILIIFDVTNPDNPYGLPVGTLVGMPGPMFALSEVTAYFDEYVDMFGLTQYTVTPINEETGTIIPCSVSVDNSTPLYSFPVNGEGVTLPGTYEIDFEFKEGTTSISNNVFGDSALISLSDNALDGIESIGDGTFSFCSSLTSVTIPDSVTSIGNEAFVDCYNLTSIEIPDSVTSIGNSAFYYCESLTSITIPDSITSIGDETFSYCSSLTSVTIPDSVTSIGDRAFEGCSGLTSVTIPDSVTSIGNSAFYYCESLTSVTISNSVTSIGDRAFEGCSGLTSVIIPDSVTSIGSYAFSGCTSLTSVEIPDSVTSISDHAFKYCIKLTSVIIPDSVTSIGGYAFNNCSGLTSVTIGNSVTSIGGEAFDDGGAFEYCSSLTSITCKSMVAPEINYYNTFRNVSYNGTLYIPEGSEGYDGWLAGNQYDLGYYNWNVEYGPIEELGFEITGEDVGFAATSTMLHTKRLYRYQILETGEYVYESEDLDDIDSADMGITFEQNLDSTEPRQLELNVEGPDGQIYKVTITQGGYIPGRCIIYTSTEDYTAHLNYLPEDEDEDYGGGVPMSLALDDEETPKVEVEELFMPAGENMRAYYNNPLVSLDRAFIDAYGLIKIDFSEADTSNVLEMNETFYNCENLEEVTGLDMDSVINKEEEQQLPV